MSGRQGHRENSDSYLIIIFANELPRSKLRSIQNGKERSKLRGILPEEI